MSASTKGRFNKVLQGYLDDSDEESDDGDDFLAKYRASKKQD